MLTLRFTWHGWQLNSFIFTSSHFGKLSVLSLYSSKSHGGLISLAALNEALTAEIQRLRIATGEHNADSMSKCFGQQLFVSPQMYQQQQQSVSSQNNANKLQDQSKAQDSNNGASAKNESNQSKQ